MAKTRDKILDSAWALFSEEGFEAVSVRDVTNAAKVNLASVSYHFNGKDGLIQEIVAKALVPMNKHRVRLLKIAGDEAGNIENVPLKKIIEAFIRPALNPEEYGGSSKMVTQLIARSLIDRKADVPSSVIESFRDVYKIFSIAMAPQCPDIEPKKALRNLMYAAGAAFMYSSFAWLAGKATENSDELGMERYLDDVINFCVAGFNKT